MPYTMLIGLVSAIYLFAVVPVPQSEGMRSLGFMGSIRESLGSA